MVYTSVEHAKWLKTVYYAYEKMTPRYGRSAEFYKRFTRFVNSRKEKYCLDNQEDRTRYTTLRRAPNWYDRQFIKLVHNHLNHYNLDELVGLLSGILMLTKAAVLCELRNIFPNRIFTMPSEIYARGTSKIHLYRTLMHLAHSSEEDGNVTQGLLIRRLIPIGIVEKYLTARIRKRPYTTKFPPAMVVDYYALQLALSMRKENDAIFLSTHLGFDHDYLYLLLRHVTVSRDAQNPSDALVDIARCFA